jgi:Family of unknown function (DUF6350)
MAFLVQRSRPTTAAEATGLSAPALRAGLLGGAAAAGAGLVAIALPLFFLWIVSPYVESGGGGVLHLAAALWLLAHGATLRFGDTPIGVPPLLLTALALLLLYRTSARTARQAADAEPPRADPAQDDPAGGDRAEDDQDDLDDSEREDRSAVRRAGSVFVGVCAGYLLVGAATTVLAGATGGMPDVAPAAALGRLTLAALPTVALGVRAGSGSWRVSLLPRYQPPSWAGQLLRWGGRTLERARVPGGGAAVLRAGAGAGAALLGGGALVFAVSLLLRFGAAGTISTQLAPDLVGRIALLLLCAVLLPNASVWAAAYALGPGFALGTGFAPLASVATVQTPVFPLLAALPGPGRSPLGLLALVVPLLAGSVAAGLLGRAAVGWGLLATVRAGVATAGCAGALAALCAAASGGPLGVSALAGVGPAPWWTGLAALAWTLLTAVPGALLVRWYLGRTLGRGDDDPVPAADGRWRVGLRWFSRRTWSASAADAASRLWRSCCRRPE